MKKQFYIAVILFLISVLSLISCDSTVNVKGKVVDYTTGKPIRNAIITIWKHKLYTDSLGCFEYNSMTGAAKPEVKLSVEKYGYKTFEMRYKGGVENYYFVKNVYVKHPNKNNGQSISINSKSFEIFEDSININLQKTEVE